MLSGVTVTVNMVNALNESKVLEVAVEVLFASPFRDQFRPKFHSSQSLVP